MHQHPCNDSPLSADTSQLMPLAAALLGRTQQHLQAVLHIWCVTPLYCLFPKPGRKRKRGSGMKARIGAAWPGEETDVKGQEGQREHKAASQMRVGPPG